MIESQKELQEKHYSRLQASTNNIAIINIMTLYCTSVLLSYLSNARSVAHAEREKYFYEQTKSLYGKVIKTKSSIGIFIP